MTQPDNEYLRNIDNWRYRTKPLVLPRIENGILLCPDGLRWRIETTPTVADVLRVGDTISTNDGTGGLIINIHRFKTCCCPLRAVSGTKYCADAWDEPVANQTYHMDVWEWSIVYVHEKDLRVRKDGTLSDNNPHCFLNSLVAFDGRILHLFENNTTEIFLVKPDVKGKSFQLPLV